MKLQNLITQLEQGVTATHIIKLVKRNNKFISANTSNSFLARNNFS